MLLIACSLREVRSNPALAGITVFLVSGDEAAEPAARAAGADGFLLKPFGGEVLRAAVERALAAR